MKHIHFVRYDQENLGIILADDEDFEPELGDELTEAEAGEMIEDHCGVQVSVVIDGTTFNQQRVSGMRRQT